MLNLKYKVKNSGNTSVQVDTRTATEVKTKKRRLVLNLTVHKPAVDLFDLV